MELDMPMRARRRPHGRGRRQLEAGEPSCRPAFVDDPVRPRSAGGPRRLSPPERARRPRRRRLRASERAAAGRQPRPPPHRPRGRARRAPPGRHGPRGRQRQHAVPARFHPRRARRPGLRADPRRASDPRRRARRRRARSSASSARRPPPRAQARQARELHPHPPRPHRRSGGPRAAVEGLERVYADVAVAVATGSPMRARVADASRPTAAIRRRSPPDEIAEAIAFLDWMVADNFTFLGVREYRFAEGDAAADPGRGHRPRPSARSDRAGPAPRRRARGDDARDPRLPGKPCGAHHHQGQRQVARAPARPSRLRRRQAVLRRRRGSRANCASSACSPRAPTLDTPPRCPTCATRSPRWSPRAGFDPASYAGRALLNVLENYPRDELFQIDDDTLYRFALDILQSLRAAAHPRPARGSTSSTASSRCSSSSRRTATTASCASPRRRVSGRRLRGPRLGRLSGLSGRPARAHPLHHRPRRGRHADDRPRRPWRGASPPSSAPGATRCATRSPRRSAAPRARALAARYANAFSGRLPGSLRRRGRARRHRRSSSSSPRHRPRAVDLYRREGDDDHAASTSRSFRAARRCRSPSACRCWRTSASGSSTSGPTGSLPAGAGEAERVWLHDMTLERASGGADRHRRRSRARSRRRSSRCSGACAESDGFNRLVLEAGLGWRDVAMVRALGRYLRQIRIAFGQDYLAATLARHAAIAAQIVRAVLCALRSARRGRPARSAEAAIRGEIEAALQRRREPRRGPHPAPLRQPRRGGPAHELLPDRARTACRAQTIAFKFDCARVEGLPLPRPLYEIFVYSPRVEGVHLRFGKVARGGLRWSDRPQDFRTEILGLVKAQQVKNAVIVPVGAKGGFVPKQLPPPRDRQAWLAEGTESYQHLRPHPARSSPTTSSATAIVPPADTVRHDGDDPYLVVAADKGTATFSDIANAHLDRDGPLARRRLRLRRQPGLRPQEDGHHRAGRLGGGEAPFPRDGRRHPDASRSRSPASATCRATCSATACCCRRRSSSSPPSTTATSSSIPTPIRKHPGPSASACSTCRARAGRTTTRALISAGGGVFSRGAKSIPLSPRGARAARPRRRRRRRRTR